MTKTRAIFPVLMYLHEVIAMPEAVKRTGRTDKTLRLLCQRYGIARRCVSSRRWEISAPALEMVMQGDLEALELLRAGDRHAPRVRRYFNHLGLPVTSLGFSNDAQ